MDQFDQSTLQFLQRKIFGDEKMLEELTLGRECFALFHLGHSTGSFARGLVKIHSVIGWPFKGPTTLYKCGFYCYNDDSFFTSLDIKGSSLGCIALFESGIGIMTCRQSCKAKSAERV